MSRTTAARASPRRSDVSVDRCTCTGATKQCSAPSISLRGRSERLLRSVDAPARLVREVAALLRWTCIAEARHCRAVAMDLHRRAEALPRYVDGPASPRSEEHTSELQSRQY